MSLADLNTGDLFYFSADLANTTTFRMTYAKISDTLVQPVAAQLNDTVVSCLKYQPVPATAIDRVVRI